MPKTLITDEEYEQFLAKQGGVCAICKRSERTRRASGVIRRLSIDHCHKTDLVRGLLCTRCNTAIGMLEDNIEFAKRLVAYLKQDLTENPKTRITLKKGSPEYCADISQRMMGNTRGSFKGKKLRDLYDLSPKLCQCCFAVIPYKKRRNSFCGLSCRTSFFNRLRAKA